MIVVIKFIIAILFNIYFSLKQNLSTLLQNYCRVNNLYVPPPLVFATVKISHKQLLISLSSQKPSATQIYLSLTFVP